MKTCFRCLKEKSLDDFYKHPDMADGHLGKCKECTRVDANKNRADKLDYYLKYDRERANLPHRIVARKNYQKSNHGKEVMKKWHTEWYAKSENRERIRVIHSEWVKNNPEKIRTSHAKWRKSNPHKIFAHQKVMIAVRSGKMDRMPCYICGKKAYAHHEDYSKPLEVMWLCPVHHRARHKQIKKEEL